VRRYLQRSPITRSMEVSVQLCDRAQTRGLLAGVLAVVCLLGGQPVLEAADQWIEVKSAHFTLTSNAGERRTRTLVWQLEQVRSATSMLWSWAKPDLNKPLAIVVVKDENGMRALAPQYWEDRRAIHPASVWVSGPDQHYLVLRSDVEIEQQGTINPYFSSYASYINLVLGQSFEGALPLWFEHGFAGVLANTIVRNDSVLVGPPVPWYLETLRDRPLLPLARILAMPANAPDVTEADRRTVFDAQTWALVHFLMFGEQGKRAEQMNVYSKLVTTGKEPVAAFAEAFGPMAPLEGAFRLYVERPLFSFQKFNIDASVEREKFPSRPITAAEAAAVRAMVLASMRRPVEARAAIAEAQKADAAAAASYVAQGLVFDQERKPDEAKAAFAKAAELGSTNPYAYYRLASLTWEQNASRELLQSIETHLTDAVRLNVRYADAYAWLGEIRVSLGNPEGLGLVRRAITLEPRESRHRLRAAFALLSLRKPAEARVEAQTALALADNDDERRRVTELLDRITRAEGAKQ